MEDRFGLDLGEYVVERFSDVSNEQVCGGLDVLPCPDRERVEDGDVVTAGEKGVHDV